MNNNISKLIFLLRVDSNFTAIAINEKSHCEYILTQIEKQTHISHVKELLLALKKSFSGNEVLFQYTSAILNAFYVESANEKTKEIISLCQLVIDELKVQLLINPMNNDKKTISEINHHLNKLINDVSSFNYATPISRLIGQTIHEVSTKNIQNKVVIQSVLYNIEAKMNSLLNIKKAMILSNNDMTKEFFKNE